MDKSVEQRREIVARYLNESASAEHSGPDMVKMGLLGKAKARDDGKMEIALSTEDLDRHGDILRSSGAVLTAFKKNPVLLFAHMHSRPAVGKVTGLKKGKRDKDGVGEITGLVEFAPTPLGEELALLYGGGFMKAFSVGFIPEKWDRIKDENGDPDPGYGLDVKKWELLEVSAVPVPANPAALSKCDMAAFKGGTEEEVVLAMKAFRTAADAPEAPKAPEADASMLEITCPVCEASFTGSPGLCPACQEQAEKDMAAEPADDIRESFQEALEELRAKVADGTQEVEETDWGKDEQTPAILVHADGKATFEDKDASKILYDSLENVIEEHPEAIVLFDKGATEKAVTARTITESELLEHTPICGECGVSTWEVDYDVQQLVCLACDFRYDFDEVPTLGTVGEKPVEKSPEDAARDTLLTNDEVIKRISGLTDAMAALRKESEATVVSLERILVIKAEIDPDPAVALAEPDQVPGEDDDPKPAVPVHGTLEEGESAAQPEQAAFTRDDALAMLKAGLADISEAVQETTKTTIRKEMGRAVDIE